MNWFPGSIKYDLCSNYWGENILQNSKKYLYPAINYVYTERKDNIKQNLKTENFNVVGDGTYDCPGRNA